MKGTQYTVYCTVRRVEEGITRCSSVEEGMTVGKVH